MINPEYLENVERLNAEFKAAEPFPHIVMKDFFTEKIDDVHDAVLKEQFHEQNSDLFQFQQSDDCKNATQQAVKECYAFFGSKEFLDFIFKLTGIAVNSIDMSAFIYDDTDYLLPHDDRLEGRKIAYVVNLAKDFTEKDGGALQLFEDKEVVKSMVPAFNSLVLFEVSPKSLHQVQEVFSDKKRITLAGWFHA